MANLNEFKSDPQIIMELIGGESLAGSGFESETSDSEFSES